MHYGNNYEPHKPEFVPHLSYKANLKINRRP